jgi:hypothetical protein
MVSSLPANASVFRASIILGEVGSSVESGCDAFAFWTFAL